MNHHSLWTSFPLKSLQKYHLLTKKNTGYMYIFLEKISFLYIFIRTNLFEKKTIPEVYRSILHFTPNHIRRN